MSNAIAPVTSKAFCVERQAKPTKSGKPGAITRRSLMGLLTSGTVEERTNAAIAIARFDWENGQYEILCNELFRVFKGSMFENLTAFCKLDRAALMRKPMIDVMENTVRIWGAAKGEKAKYVKLCADLIEWSKGEADRKEARRLAYEQGNAVETC